MKAWVINEEDQYTFQDVVIETYFELRNTVYRKISSKDAFDSHTISVTQVPLSAPVHLLKRMGEDADNVYFEYVKRR